MDALQEISYGINGFACIEPWDHFKPQILYTATSNPISAEILSNQV
ncbi:hypothetical protein [Carnobacterium jeotgali]